MPINQRGSARRDGFPNSSVTDALAIPMAQPRSTCDSADRRGGRTLVVSWHWPPTRRASTAVLARLFRATPHGVFTALTPRVSYTPHDDPSPIDAELESRTPAHRVSPPRPTRLGEDPTSRVTGARTIIRMIRAATAAHRQRAWNGVLGVYPHRYGLLAAWIIARRLKRPLIAYLHDLLSDGTVFSHPARRMFWKAMERRILTEATLILVPTAEFAEHYARRGFRNAQVLPHCTDPADFTDEPPPLHAGLHLLYSGQVYEPHRGAMEAFILATRDLHGVQVTYLTHPEGAGGLLAEVGARWLPHDRWQIALQQADVGVLVLGTETACPHEARGCFPSKLLDYLTIARPVLAVVPPRSFVERFITETGCGLAVTDHRIPALQDAVDTLRDPRVRERMAAAARRARDTLRNDLWSTHLVRQLQDTLNPATRSVSRPSGIDWTEASGIPKTSTAEPVCSHFAA